MARSTVFEQALKHISRSKFQASVYRHEGDKHIKSFDCWSWFVALLYGQFTGNDSIRSIVYLLAHSCKRLKKLKIAPVKRSTLADANQTRPLEILEETLYELIQKAKASTGYQTAKKILALDSTTIMLCLSLSKWANYRRDTAGIKLHTAFDVATALPEFHVVTKAIRHDAPIAQRYFDFSKGTTLILDRAYWNSAWLAKLDQHGVFFVTRERANVNFKHLKSCASNRTQGIICDQLVRQHNPKKGPEELYPGKLRRIKFRDPDTKKVLVFITNHFDLCAQAICDLYKRRWEIEIFFKTLKQHLKIKRFLGTSFRAVKAQILVALIAYVCVHICRSVCRAVAPMNLCMAIMHALSLETRPLNVLFGKLPATNRHPPDRQLSLQL